MGQDGVMTKTIKRGKTNSTQTLEFTLSTSNVPELKKTAEDLKSMWAKIGVKMDIAYFDPGDLNQKVIKPRRLFEKI